MLETMSAHGYAGTATHAAPELSTNGTKEERLAEVLAQIGRNNTRP